jgi:hypothetical protein
MNRLLDLVAVIAVAVVVLLPKASVEARPALEGDPVELERVSRLQDDLYREPTNARTAVQLADAFLSFFRADWAIATLAPFVAWERAGRLQPDAEVHLVLATAHAERLEPGPCVDEARRVEEVCAAAADTPRCPDGTLARSRLIAGSMQALLDKGIDPAKDPQHAKEEVYRVLHPSRPAFRLPR